ncbi:MAG: hypothetical protein K2X47_09540, partial [Bdellovibrionales bacterium]|nr:hypothetical protein [Bdellovibrionales bacterium]
MARFKDSLKIVHGTVLGLLVVFAGISASGKPPVSFNPGPDVRTPMGREFVDIIASNPDFGWVSTELLGEQKFRTQDGLIIGRQLFGKNQVKAIVWGQDGTHGAKVAGQSAAGASFAASAQAIMNYVGLDSSLAFSNQFLTTIYGQYGTASVPYVEIMDNGVPTIHFAKIVSNGLFTLANHPKSPITMSRVAGLDWNLRQNPDELKLMVMLGGAAKDGMGSWLEANGYPVETQYTDADLARMHQPLWKSVSAGSNLEFAVPLDRNGKDIYEILLGRKPNYSDEKDQAAAKAALEKDVRRALSLMVFPGGGINNSGFVHRAQLGGFQLGIKYTEEGQKKVRAISLKGHRLSDGSIVKNDVLIADFPHPTAIGLARNKAERSAMLARKVSVLDYHRQRGWKIDPDPGFKNMYHDGLAFNWEEMKKKARIPIQHFEFGIPGIRSTHDTDAGRLNVRALEKGNHIATVSLAGRVRFDVEKIRLAYETPVIQKDPRDILTTRARGSERYEFDPGPSERFERAFGAMTPELVSFLYELKPGMTLEKDGVSALRTAVYPDLKAYAP